MPESLEFSTPVSVPKYPFSCDYTGGIALMGSCFADTMATYLIRHKFQVQHNPWGLQYQPLAVLETLERSLNNEEVPPSELQVHEDLHFHWLHHSLLAQTDPRALRMDLNQRLRSWKEQLSRSSLLVLTLGTAWAYNHEASDTWVGNCHKVPGREFRKHLLDVDTMLDAATRVLDKLFVQFPNLNVLLTVSPIRHRKDGLIENQRSKARLLELVHSLSEQYASVHYFPAYEILLDELRDYRFYARDLVHPSPLATDLIWQRFSKAIFSEPALELMNKVGQVQRALEHRPFRPEAPVHRQFLEQTLERMEASEFALIDWSAEIKELEAKVREMS